MTDNSVIYGTVYALLVLWFALGIKIESRDNTINGLKSIKFNLNPVIIGIIFYFMTT